MAKKLNAVSALDVDDVPSGDGSPDAFVFGGLKKLDTGVIKAMPISIMEIYPDPTQPRRAVPSAIRAAWDGTPAGVQAALKVWWDLATTETGTAWPLMDMIFGEGEAPDSDAVESLPPITSALLELCALAAGIRRDGLINPITVVKTTNDKGTYQRIETGERRWWAYHLLRLLDSDSGKWDKIPARVVDAFSRWRQATENNQRAQLNAIARARQLAILLMDLHGIEHFAGFDDMVPPGACDRAFYAQVGDGDLWRVPRGQSSRLVEAMGLQNPQQLRQYRMLLRIDDDLWQRADDENWAELRIRMAWGGDSVSTDTVSAEDSPLPQPHSALTPGPSPLTERGEGQPIITPDSSTYQAALDAIAAQADAPLRVPTGSGQGDSDAPLSQMALWGKDVDAALKRVTRYTPQSIRNSDVIRRRALEDAAALEEAAAAIRRMAGGG